MPSTYSTSLRLTLQAPGEGTNTWGTILNTGVFGLVDTAISGRTSFTLSGTKTLTTNNGASDEARAMVLDVTGGTGGTITIPSVSKVYLVRNASSGDVVLTTGSGATATLKTLNYAFVICNGTDVYRGPAQADIDASLAAAKTYADGLASQSGNLPGVAGNAGRYLTTDGNTASWGALGTVITYNVGTSNGQIPVLTTGGGLNLFGPIQSGSNVNAGLNMLANGYFQVGASGSSGQVYFGSTTTRGALGWTNSNGFTLNDGLAITNASAGFGLSTTTGTNVPFHNMYNGTTLIGQITNNGSNVSFNNLSDARYKTKTDTPDTGALVDAVGALVTGFDIKIPGVGKRSAVGVFAQELYPVAPRWVTPGDDKNLAPDEKGFKPWLVSASEPELILFRELMLLRQRVAALGG